VNTRALRIAVIGGGIGGLTAAVALRQPGLRSTYTSKRPS
jgi:2-polyprenyl-6-methoxyphenol hydroxylase-like FAD-dependent oxidoreductase